MSLVRTNEKVAAVIERTLETTPADATHWSLRSMARESGLSQRRSGGYGRPSSRTARRKLSSDPVRGQGPRHRRALSGRRTARWCSVSNQIQALDRTQPVADARACLSAATYKRHGTPRCSPPSMSPPASSSASATDRAREFLDFLKEIDRRAPEGLDLHIVMDNYATHKTAAVKAWLARRAHWHIHFTPTSASWINQVERWFAELTRKQLQRGVHTFPRLAIFRTTSSPPCFCLRVDQNLQL